MIVIWTLARTGGTATTVVLRRLLGERKTYHEPMNPNQIWGELATIEPFRDEVVAAELEPRLQDRPIIKHCVETVPVHATKGLLQATIKAGYHHVVLARRDERARITSWLLMAATGAASREALNALDTQSIEGRLDRLNKAHLVRAAAVSELGCKRLNLVKALLDEVRADHLVVAYEDMFLERPKGRSNPTFQSLLRFVGLDPDAPFSERDRAFIDRWLIDGHQGSAQFYPDIERRLGRLPEVASGLEFDVGETRRQAPLKRRRHEA